MLRTNANTISCQAIAYITDALNGKIVDWPAIFKENMLIELKSLKEELYKDKTTMLKTMVGPPLTILLLNEGVMSVQQELAAGMLVPSKKLEQKPPNKKRKSEYQLVQTDGASSKQGEQLQILVANIEPAVTTDVLISTNGTSDFKQASLTEIHHKIAQANQLLEIWITDSTKTTQHKGESNAGSNQDHMSALTKISELQMQLQDLQRRCDAAEAQNGHIAETHQLEIEEIQQKYQLQTNTYAEAEEQTRQVLTNTQTRLKDSQQNYEVLHNQYTSAIEENRMITEIARQQEAQVQNLQESAQKDRRYRKKTTATVVHRLEQLRSCVSEI